MYLNGSYLATVGALHESFDGLEVYESLEEAEKLWNPK